MRNVLLFGLAVLVLTCTATAYGVGFTAYNDFVTSYTANPNVTHWGQPQVGSPQILKDEATGLTVTPTMTMTRLNTVDNGGGPGAEISGGTDAAAIFGGKVAAQGNVIYYGTQNNWWYNVEFTGLDNSKTYEVAAVVDRGQASYNNVRWTMISLLDADSSTYASSAGAYKVSETATSMTVYNTLNGYVAKWVDVKPGADGDFSLYFSSPTDLEIPSAYRPQAGDQIGKGYAPAGIMLREIPEPSSLVLLLVAGGLGWAATAYRRRK